MAKKGWGKYIVIGIVILFVIFATVMLSILSFFASLFSAEIVEKGNVAVIQIKGPIVGDGDDNFFASQGSAVSSKIVEKIKKAEEDESIYATILEINSPGGSPVASDEVATAVEKAKKPVVAVIRETGDSGAYWIASSADEIIAHH